MKKWPALLPCLLISSITVAAPEPVPSARYAGQVQKAAPGSAEIWRENRFVPLPAGSTVVDGDCIRATSAAVTVQLEMDDDSPQPIAYRANGCETIHARSKEGNATYIDYVLGLFSGFSRSRSARHDASTRAGEITLAALGVPRERAQLRAGTRPLYFGWCVPGDMAVKLVGPAGAGEEVAVSDRRGLVYPATSFEAGTKWKVQIRRVGGARTWSAGFDIVENMPGAVQPREMPRAVGKLAAAANLARKDDAGRYDFEAMQMLTGGADAEMQDEIANWFCPNGN